ncbi:MAG: ATP-binding protein, partial [Pseudomonadota bacterium]
LFDNAADASPNSVNVKSSWQAHEAKIIIADQGEGIDPNLISEIGTKPYSSKPDGIGLGAFLAHEIIQRLGGAIQLKNRSEGGLETIVTLPLQTIK